MPLGEHIPDSAGSVNAFLRAGFPDYETIENGDIGKFNGLPGKRRRPGRKHFSVGWREIIRTQKGEASIDSLEINGRTGHDFAGNSKGVGADSRRPGNIAPEFFELREPGKVFSADGQIALRS